MQISPSSPLFFFNATPPTEIYTLSLHDALPILLAAGQQRPAGRLDQQHLRLGHDLLQRLLPVTPAQDRDGTRDRKSTRLNSSHVEISYAVFCLKKKKKKKNSKANNKRTQGNT